MNFPERNNLAQRRGECICINCAVSVLQDHYLYKECVLVVSFLYKKTYLSNKEKESSENAVPMPKMIVGKYALSEMLTNTSVWKFGARSSYH